MASKYRKKYDLPEGFYDILQDYSREVLRDQPLDIIEFSYMYFKAQEEVSLSSLRKEAILIACETGRLLVSNRFMIMMLEIFALFS